MIARIRSIEMLSIENSPVARKAWPRPSLRMIATRTWLTVTNATAAASPAIARRAFGFEITPPAWSVISAAAPHAASASSV